MDWIAGNSLYKSSLEYGVMQYICNNVVSAYHSYLVYTCSEIITGDDTKY
jgi:hypothetical protein